MGIIRDFLNFRKIKYSPIFSLRGDYAVNANMDNSDVVGAIADCIARNVGKLSPQLLRSDEERGFKVRGDRLARLLSLRWAPELSAYDALYKIGAHLVRYSNSFSVIFYDPDFIRVTSIVPIEVSDYRIWEESGRVLFQFCWTYDGKTYTVPYENVIHIRARFDRSRFIGTPPDSQIRNSLELLDVAGQGIRNVVKNSAGLRGYLRYTNFASDEDLKAKVREFQEAYMTADNSGGLAGLDNTMEFHEITQRSQQIPTASVEFFRQNIYRYYGVNENILTSHFTESEWNAFYESTIEPIALQLSLECTFKLLTERERGFGNRIVFLANRLQYASLQTRAAVGGTLFDRGAITINEYRGLVDFEPIEGGNVRMVSLNFVKAGDQSLYQVGKEGTEEAAEETAEPAARLPAGIMANVAYIETRLKGAKDYAESG